MDITASSITFVTSAFSAYHLIKKIKDLPKEFDEVENRLPLARDTLTEFQKLLGFEGLEPGAREAIEKVLTPCQANAKKLKAIFDAIQKHSGENGLSRYRIVIIKMGKASRVEVLLQGIMKSLEQLVTNHEARMANLLPQLSAAVAALSKIKSSVPDEDFEATHASSFTQHIASGGTGHQTVNNAHGPQTNNYGGRNYSTNGAPIYVNSPVHRDTVLQKLETITYRDAKDRNRRPVEGTCRWVVEHDVFQEWKNAPSSALLWLSADPGCGKSVLARHLVDSVLADQKPCYFFFKDGYSGQTTADSALGCILHQILTTRADMFSDEIMRRFEVSSQIYHSTNDLWDVLETLARAMGSEIICILDAFDECRDEDRDVLARLLREFYEHRSAASRLKFLVTSRPYYNIRQKFRIEPSIPIIHLNGETPEESQKIAKEINIFLESEIAEMEQNGRLSDRDANSLRTWMHNVINRTYLWAYLVLVEINHRPGEHFALALSELPKTVNDAYEKMLAKTATKYKRKQVEKLLHIVLAATRPLSIDEMYIALTIEQQHKCHKDVGSPEKDFETYIREACGLFVYIVDSKVYLFHQTAREFLVSTAGVQHLSAKGTTQWQHSFESKVSNLILYRSCAWYLLLIEAAAINAKVNALLLQLSDDATTADRANIFKRYAFYEYCATFWADHYRWSETSELDLSLALLEEKGNSTEKASQRLWFSAYWMLIHGKLADESFTPLIVASYFGLVNVVRHITRTCTKDINNVERSSHRSALSFAAEKGFTKVVDHLFSKSHEVSWRFWWRLDINNACSEGQTPLIYAASNGHVDTVRLLISAGAKTDVCDNLDETALSYALAYGHSSVARELAGKSFVNSVGATIQTLLSKAVKMKRYTSLPRLLESGASMDGCDSNGFTPLLIAIRENDHDMVCFLLRHGARPYIPDDGGYTPYFHCFSKSSQIVGTILEHLNTGDFTMPDDPRQVLNTKYPSRIPLEYLERTSKHACHMGYENIAGQILKFLSQPTFFLISIVEGFKDHNYFYELLQDQMATTNVHTRTLLLREALQQSNLTAARYLLRSGVDLEERDAKGQTVIFDAAMQPNHGVLQMLVSAGAAIETHNLSGRTPLHQAAYHNLGANVAVLLLNGANIEAKDSRHCTPLIVAILGYDRYGESGAVDLLWLHGADTRARTPWGETAVQMATNRLGGGASAEECFLTEKLFRTGQQPLRDVSSFQPPIIYLRDSQMHLLSASSNLRRLSSLRSSGMT